MIRVAWAMVVLGAWLVALAALLVSTPLGLLVGGVELIATGLLGVQVDRRR